MAPLVQGLPAGRVADMGGPEALGFAEIVRRFLSAQGRRRPVVELALPGKTVRAFREGRNLALDHPDGRITWDEYLSRTT